MTRVQFIHFKKGNYMTSLPIDNVQVLPDSRANEDARLTVEEVGSALLKNQERFDSLFDDVQSVTTLFSNSCTIMPMQCREAIQTLRKVRQNTQHIHRLLDEPDHLPFIFTALRYRLLFQIHLIDERVQQLICFIESYRAICTHATSSFGSLQRRKQIYHILETLSDAIADISQQIHFIKHEVLFHQAKLSAHSREISTNDTLDEHDNSKKCILCLPIQEQ
jgi:hypothetical protein